MAEEDKILELIKLYHTVKEFYKDRMPYHFNIIDAVCNYYKIDENANTRILVQLLKYKTKGTLPFLSSFLEMVLQHIGLSLNELPAILHPIIEDQHYVNTDGKPGYIDALLYEKGQYAFILESKIENAVAQDEQIDRYVISIVKDFDIPENKVFVVYLLRDKYGYVPPVKVHKAQKILNVSDKIKGSEGRFVVLNYKEDILSWFETIVHDIPIKQKELVSGLYQYIDYLKGIFNLRENTIKMDDKIIKEIANKLGINISPNSKDEYDALCHFTEEISRLRDGLNRASDKAYQSAEWNMEQRLPKQLARRLQNHYTDERYCDDWKTLFDKAWLWSGDRDEYDDTYFVLGDKSKLALDFDCSTYKQIKVSLFCRGKEKVQEDLIKRFEYETALRLDEYWGRLVYTFEYVPNPDVTKIELHSAFYPEIEKFFHVLHCMLHI